MRAPRQVLWAATAWSLAWSPWLGPWGELPAPDPVSARQAVDALRPVLENGHLARAPWERAAREAAETLGPDPSLDLLWILSADEAAPLERVAAAELFRRLSHRGSPPGAADLARLRRDAFGGLPDSALAGAARRVLVDLGDWSDRLRLIRELETAQLSEVRLNAAWCLRAVRTHEVLLDLAELLGPGVEPQAAELAAATLETIVRASEPLEADRRSALVERALAAINAPFCPPQLEQRLSGLLGALDDGRARGRLELLVREGRAPAARALATSAPGRGVLTRIVNDPLAGDAAHMAAAAALAWADPEHPGGLEVLVRIAEQSLGMRERRGAVLALGQLASAPAERSLERVSSGDADPDLRALAAQLLAAHAHGQ